MSCRPVLYVLAGVNGAGKSSIGGYLLERAGLAWFNPDDFARQVRELTGCDPVKSNGIAWTEGMRRLDKALAQGTSHAFETTLGGRTVALKIRAAARTHDLMIWFCGLASPELHIKRVSARVAAGGHDIPEAKIRERFPAALGNLIALMPFLHLLQVHDNSTQADSTGLIPDPALVLEVRCGKLVWPITAKSLRLTPDWAKPLVEAALQLK